MTWLWPFAWNILSLPTWLISCHPIWAILYHLKNPSSQIPSFDYTVLYPQGTGSRTLCVYQNLLNFHSQPSISTGSASMDSTNHRSVYLSFVYVLQLAESTDVEHANMEGRNNYALLCPHRRQFLLFKALSHYIKTNLISNQPPISLLQLHIYILFNAFFSIVVSIPSIVFSN